MGGFSYKDIYIEDGRRALEVNILPEKHCNVEEYISNMVSFNKQYNGKLIFEITIIKGYNDDEESIQKLKNIIKEISPDKVIVARMEDEPFKKKLGITDERFEEISNALLNI